MACETANIHLGTPKVVKAVQEDLDKRRAKWLRDAAKKMYKAVLQDWKQWKNS